MISDIRNSASLAQGGTAQTVPPPPCLVECVYFCNCNCPIRVDWFTIRLEEKNWALFDIRYIEL